MQSLDDVYKKLIETRIADLKDELKQLGEGADAEMCVAEIEHLETLLKGE